MTVSRGGGGWCQLELDDPAVAVMVRFDQAPTGRVVIAEMSFARLPGMTADSLRAFPFGRVEAWANGPGRDNLLVEVARRSSPIESGPSWTEIDDGLRGYASRQAQHSAAQLVQQEAMMAEPTTAGVSEQLAAGEVAMGPGGQVLRSRVRNLRLRVPKGQPKPDSFYREVARLFGEVSVNTPRPAAVLAEANEVPVARIHGWVKEARRRGLLAPGERQVRRKS